jgi:hypothetical protein
MRFAAVLTLGCFIALWSPALAQNIPGGSIPVGALGAMPAGGGIPVSDTATEANTYNIAISVATGGMYGGFDPSLELQGDLEQLVSSNNGLPLDNAAISRQYGTLWPGYSNASYNQSFARGSPEGDMQTTLETFEGALQGAADQQKSQGDELARLQRLEAENAAAVGVLQALEVSNEIDIFGNELEMKLRNSTNAQLNALVIAESNRQNKEAQGELESLTVAGENIPWDFTNNPDPSEPALPPGGQL